MSTVLSSLNTTTTALQAAMLTAALQGSSLGLCQSLTLRMLRAHTVLSTAAADPVTAGSSITAGPKQDESAQEGPAGSSGVPSGPDLGSLPPPLVSALQAAVVNSRGGLRWELIDARILHVSILCSVQCLHAHPQPFT